MNPGLQRRQLIISGIATALGAAWAPARAAEPAAAISFRGTSFVHRWSKDSQHEFTPENDADLRTWRDMLTLNVHEATRSGEQLADIANRVLGNYQQHGKVLVTRSVPRTAQRPAEHLIVAVLGNPQLLEATFARCMLHDGTGVITVVSHRVYGQGAGPQMSEWLKAHGQPVEQSLMALSALPSVASLKKLPRSA